MSYNDQQNQKIIGDILGRIFSSHLPKNLEEQFKRRYDRLKSTKLYQNSSIVNQQSIKQNMIFQGKKEKQRELDMIEQKLTDIDSISKFHDDYFQLGNKLKKQKMEEREQERLNNPLQKLINSNPKLVKMMTSKDLMKGSNFEGTFSFGQYQKEFKKFWGNKVKKLSEDDQERLRNILEVNNGGIGVNADVYFEAQNKVSNNEDNKQLQEVLQLQQILLQKKKGDSKPILMLRKQRLFSKQEEAYQVIKEVSQQKPSTAYMGGRSNQSLYSNNRYNNAWTPPQTVKRPSTKSFQFRHEVCDQLQKIISPVTNKDNSQFRAESSIVENDEKSENIYQQQQQSYQNPQQQQVKIPECNILMEGIKITQTQNQFIKSKLESKKKSSSLSEFERNMKKCDEILYNSNMETIKKLPNFEYDKIKFGVKQARYQIIKKSGMRPSSYQTTQNGNYQL